MHHFYLKCPNTRKYPSTPQLHTTDALFNKMFQYLHIEYYRRTFLKLFSKNWFCFLFHLLTSTNATILWDAMLLALFLHLHLFKCFAFFKFVMSGEKSDKNNSIRIIFIKIIIKINITKIYIKETHSISINYNITKIFIKVEHIFMCV